MVVSIPVLTFPHFHWVSNTIISKSIVNLAQIIVSVPISYVMSVISYCSAASL